MAFDFQSSPHEEAVALLEGKPALVKKIFMQLLPELRARAFTVAGIEDANLLEQIRDEISALPKGQTWDESKKNIAGLLTDDLGEEAAQRRADLVLRVNSFQAWSSASYRAQQADAGTTHLQYLHGNCTVPTPSHLALNGIILPKDDPFWLTHTGPWGHLGCVCYTRGMSPEQVDEERDADKKRPPEDKLVFHGPMLDKLNQGTLIRGPRAYDVAPPDDPKAFHWHPEDLRIPLAQLKARYEPDVFAVFEDFAKRTPMGDGRSVWDWLNETGREVPAPIAQIEVKPGEPEPAPRPGKNVSEHVTVKSRSVKPIVHVAMDQIDKVHGDGGLPAVAVDGKPGARALGVYRPFGNTIGVKPSGPHPPLTMAHEIGHLIDRRAFGTTAYAWMSETEIGAVWRAAIEQTEAFKQLKASVPRTLAERKYLNYLLDPKELWARSYAQFIAERSGHPPMLEALKQDPATLFPWRQWAADDFKKVGQEIEKLLRSLHWI